MKPLYFWIVVSLFSTGCQKEVLTPLTPEHNIAANKVSSFLDSAFQFLKTNLSEPDFNKVDLLSFQVLQLNHNNTGIKIFEKGETGDNFILLIRNHFGFTGRRINISGIKTSKKHSGIIQLETLGRHPVTRYIVKNNRVTSFTTAQNSRAVDICTAPGPPQFDPSFNKIIQHLKSACELPEVIITAGGNSGPVNFYSLFWMSGGDASYFYYYTPAEVSGGGEGYGTGDQNNGAVAAPAIYSPDFPVSDLKNELKCFTVISNATYSISINVNQPVPGSRDIFNPLSSFPVGHTFLTFRQVNGDGTEIVRNVGYYPRNGVKPGSTTDAATFGEDSNTPFDISLKINVSANDFMSVAGNMIFQQRILYDIENFNCTTSAIEALKSINIFLPETKSNNILFGGLNPADFAEDLKLLNLDNFSAKNGGRKIIRVITNDNTQKAPAKAGGC